MSWAPVASDFWGGLDKLCPRQMLCTKRHTEGAGSPRSCLDGEARGFLVEVTLEVKWQHPRLSGELEKISVVWNCCAAKEVFLLLIGVGADN